MILHLHNINIFRGGIGHCAKLLPSVQSEPSRTSSPPKRPSARSTCRSGDINNYFFAINNLFACRVDCEIDCLPFWWNQQLFSCCSGEINNQFLAIGIEFEIDLNKAFCDLGEGLPQPVQADSIAVSLFLHIFVDFDKDQSDDETSRHVYVRVSFLFS